VGQAESAADPTYRIEAGFEFPSETLTVTAAEQRRLHDWCDIPAARYGGSADPTFLARRPILLNTASMAAARPEVGKVHIVHHLVQHRAIALDTPMTMTGRFTEIADYPRGWIAHSVWDFRTNDGASVLTVEPQVMMIDPERARQPGEGGKAAAKPAEDASGLRLPRADHRRQPNRQLPAGGAGAGPCAGNLRRHHPLPPPGILGRHARHRGQARR
jgi:hypothetical protein